jgi:hypothetical protein
MPGLARSTLHHIGEGTDAARAVRPELAVVLRLQGAALILLDIAARQYPLAPQLRQARHDVDARIGIGIGAGGVIDAD